MRRTVLTVLAVVVGLLFLNLAIAVVNIAFLKPWKLDPHQQVPYFAYRGALHIHSRHSDGSGSLPEIVQAARQRDLDFIWITDHNTLALLDSADAYQRPVVLVGAELSLPMGHLLIYGPPSLPRKGSGSSLPELLAATERTQGFAAVAHPFHPRIRWRDRFPDSVHAVEILNADVEWRNDSKLELLGALTGLLFSRHAMHGLIDPPRRELRFWDQLNEERRVVGIGSVDAHAKIKLSPTAFWRFPSYVQTFALIETVVCLRSPLESKADSARRQIVQALRQGHAAFGFAGLGSLTSVAVLATDRDRIALPGDSLALQSGARWILRIHLPSGFPFEAYLYHDGVRIRQSRLAEIDWELERPGTYRVAVFQRRWRIPAFRRVAVPWYFSNPFYAYRPPNPSNRTESAKKQS